MIEGKNGLMIMNGSKKPQRMRKAKGTMPKHKLVKAMSAHLSEKLAAELKTRAMPVRKNDIVKIMRGEFEGRDGKVIRVDTQAHRIYVEKVIRKKSNGEEFEVAIDPSKVMIVDLEMKDKRRL